MGSISAYRGAAVARRWSRFFTSASSSSSSSASPPPRTRVREILSSPAELTGRAVTIQGWVRTVRAQKTFTFLEVNDGSMLSSVQVIVPTTGDDAAAVPEGLTTGASVSVEGKVCESPAKGQAVEVSASAVSLIGACDPASYPLQKKRQWYLDKVPTGLVPAIEFAGSGSELVWESKDILLRLEAEEFAQYKTLLPAGEKQSRGRPYSWSAAFVTILQMFQSTAGVGSIDPIANAQAQVRPLLRMPSSRLQTCPRSRMRTHLCSMPTGNG